ncbi:DUF4097 family beta strand repeat-containing protein [Actinophytocola sp.]|uniref:DUF4097 family beta strand repeat-containing protein n=1 Tax=Actinophytocola sp. TaxID=1872138 RepID=UPI00389A1C84
MRIRYALVGVTVLAGGLLLAACNWVGIADEKFSDSRTLSESVGEVRIASDSGDVTITSGDKLEVHRDVSYGDAKPGETFHVDGNVLVLEDCPEQDCRVDYDVTVPKVTKVSGHLDSGDLEVTGATSANVEAESGDVTLRDVDGEVNAKARSGNVDLSGIQGAVVAGARSGNVTVALAEPGSVTASTSSGDVDVTVPKGRYRVVIQADEATNELGGGTSGPRIELRSDSGDVTLRPA